MVATATGIETGARTDLMVLQRESGATLQEIGDQWGLTRERVRQLIAKVGGPTSADARTERHRQSREDDARDAEQVAQWVRDNGPVLRDDLLEEFPGAADHLNRWMRRGLVPRTMVLFTGHGNYRRPVDRDDVVESVGRVWRRNGRPTGSRGGFTGLAYDGLRGPGDASHALICARWSWNEVCADAGVPYAAPARKVYEPEWTDRQIRARVARWWYETDAIGGSPSFHSYEAWAKRNGGPSGATVRNRFKRLGIDRWADMCRASLDDGNRKNDSEEGS